MFERCSDASLSVDPPLLPSFIPLLLPTEKQRKERKKACHKREAKNIQTVPTTI
jgi:hypothetical protein